MCIYAHVCMCECMYACMCVYIYIHTRMSMHTHKHKVDNLYNTPGDPYLLVFTSLYNSLPLHMGQIYGLLINRIW